MAIRMHLDNGIIEQPIMHDKDGAPLEGVAHRVLFDRDGRVLKSQSYIVDWSGREAREVLMTEKHVAAIQHLAALYYIYWSGLLELCGDDPGKDPPPQYLLDLQSSTHRCLRRLGIDAYLIYGDDSV